MSRQDPQTGRIWTPISVEIRRNVDGEVAVHMDEGCVDFPDIGHINTFIWEDGNYACDCNRNLFFHRARGTEREETRVDCNPWSEPGCALYAVRITDQSSGKVIYDELGVRKL